MFLTHLRDGGMFLFLFAWLLLFIVLQTKGVLALVEGLQCNRGLLVLDLEYKSIVSGEALGTLLKKHPTLAVSTAIKGVGQRRGEEGTSRVSLRVWVLQKLSSEVHILTEMSDSELVALPTVPVVRKR